FTLDPGTEVYIVNSDIAFDHDYTNCYILHDAIRRLADRLRLRHWPADNRASPTAMISTVRIRITSGCDESCEALWPSESMNEMYSVLVADGELVIEAEEIWGVLHGLETIAQLVHRSQTNTPIIEAQRIEDKPRYPHRARENQMDNLVRLIPPSITHMILCRNSLDEIKAVFPDNMVHLGGDEVDFACWASNPDVQAFMEKMKFGDDYSKLQSYYMERLSELAQKAGGGRPMTTFVWQEVFDHGFRDTKNMVIHVWKNEDWKEEMKNITAAGFPVIYSSIWYLNVIEYGVDWIRFYNLDPADFGGTPEQIALVRGGEAAMWGEYVDETNLISRSW
ncbi:hypothetical protein AHF37_09118, partial [Paragonimus kellicotti]